jgi:poly-beta-1,6-N-acetyl-D-glucosamine biosynthesis protein PgaD
VTELVINNPHLQTWGQRIGALALNIFGWLLWCYFFFPLVSLGCWFMDYNECSQWVNLSGGYLNFQDRIVIYAQSIGLLIVVWIVWVIYNLAINTRKHFEDIPSPVSQEELCEVFNVANVALRDCQQSRIVIVHFDQAGNITSLDKG